MTRFDTVRVATGYRWQDQILTEFPRQQRALYECEPIYEDLPGWRTDITSARTFGDLPAEARAYVEYVQEHAETPVGWVSVGPERSQMLEIG